ncbi:MAG: HlyD family efflux transporter periplasmic adaptor subunit [Maritimibacter sp.]
MRFLRRGLTGLFLLAVTIALLALAGQTLRSAISERMAQQARQMPARERVYAVNLVTITPETLVPVMSAFGDIRARRTLELRAQVGGPIVALGDGFEDGGQVRAGQLLLKVDPTDLEDTLALVKTDLIRAEAEKRDAEAALAIATDDLAAARRQAELRAVALIRQQDLTAKGVGTTAAEETAALADASAQQAVLSKRTALANAEARVAQAETGLDRQRIAVAEAQRRLAETELRAAFSGTLSQVTAAEGRIVTANEKVATLVDPGVLEVAFRLSTAQHARLIDASGQLIPADVTVKLAVSGIELSVPGKIDRESAVVDAGQTGRLIYARLEAAPGLRPGDFVTVEILEPALDGVASLPASALGGSDTVLVLGENDRLEELPAEVLRRQGENVLIRAGDLTGREVVTERQPMLGAGIRVRPFREAPVPEQSTAPASAPASAAPESIALDEARRARLIAFVKDNDQMPEDAKARLLEQLEQPDVPVSVIERLESRMGG